MLEAESAEVARRILLRDKAHVDAALVDMYLGHTMGSALCGELARARPDLLTRLILVSGDAITAVEEMVREALPCPVLAKPFELDELDRLLEDVLAAG